MRVSVNVVYFPGTNCERETARAFENAGASVRVRFVTDILAGRARLDDADILCFPGGFSYGDHIGAGSVAALQLMVRIPDQLQACRDRPLLCICNGFQIGAKAQLFGPNISLTFNSNGTFRHIHDQPHQVNPACTSPWLSGLAGQVLHFPCAHGEGRFVFTSHEGWKPAIHYPPGQNPDGSMENIAGIVSPNGLTLGIMNHPERAPNRSANLEIFRNGVRAAG